MCSACTSSAATLSSSGSQATQTAETGLACASCSVHSSYMLVLYQPSIFHSILYPTPTRPKAYVTYFSLSPLYLSSSHPFFFSSRSNLPIRIVLVVISVLGFIVLDFAYVAVVVNYSFQCQLIIYLLYNISCRMKTREWDIEYTIKVGVVWERAGGRNCI